jgi:hypothetical protein
MIIVIVETDLADCDRARLIATRNDPLRNILIPGARFVRMNTLEYTIPVGSARPGFAQVSRLSGDTAIVTIRSMP